MKTTSNNSIWSIPISSTAAGVANSVVITQTPEEIKQQADTIPVDGQAFVIQGVENIEISEKEIRDISKIIYSTL